jgi:predicted AAA+ superfamily ATPase
MNALEQTKHDVSEVLSVVDYDFDQAKRHEETLEAYNRVRSLLKATPELLEVLESVAARWDKDDDQDAPELGAAIRAAISKARS